MPFLSVSALPAPPLVISDSSRLAWVCCMSVSGAKDHSVRGMKTPTRVSPGGSGGREGPSESLAARRNLTAQVYVRTGLYKSEALMDPGLKVA